MKIILANGNVILTEKMYIKQIITYFGNCDDSGKGTVYLESEDGELKGKCL